MKLIQIGNKKPEKYKDILIKADRGLHAHIASKISELLPTGSKIADLGAGEGALSQRLNDMGYNVISVDENQKEFKAKNEFCKIDFNKNDQTENFKRQHAESFDCIIAVEVIEHVESPWELVRFMKQLVKINGLIIISTPNVTSWLSRMNFLFKGQFMQFEDHDLDYGHISPITSWELNNILKTEGLEVISTIPSGELSPLWLSSNKKFMFFNFISLLFRPFMKGIIDGWVILSISRKKQRL